MTAEKIKEIAASIPEGYEIALSEIQTIYEAAEKDPLWLIGYAYAYGFQRGTRAAKEVNEQRANREKTEVPA